jgi:ParB family chromosome partitioning protein
VAFALTDPPDYLNQLVHWGYKPSVVELLIIDSGKPAEEEPDAA